MTHTKTILTLFASCLLTGAKAQGVYTDSDSTSHNRTLQGVEVVRRRPDTVKSRGITNMLTINSSELMKAACCNLGESFTTNPSVDVNYSDAATGARQIKLLGLSGRYVQMLTENIPNYRNLATPYALGYVPGPWMQSIQVSKGAASVKNGYESITGQINVEFLKPQADEQVDANIFADTKGRIEANADGNLHLSDRWSANLLLHYQDSRDTHDSNHDGFADMPAVRQFNVQQRWAYFSPRYIMQASVKALSEKRQSGQRGHHAAAAEPYLIDIDADRYEAFAKNAFFLDDQQNANIALILSASWHNHDALYGHKAYDATERTLYGSLLFETTLATRHQLSAGLSMDYDHLKEQLTTDGHHLSPARDHETTPGAYAQYTLTLSDQWTMMAGLRADHSSLWGWFITPRAHLKYSPTDKFSLRASAGKGYRTVHALSENNQLLASGRTLVVEPLRQEAAWNYGINASLQLPIARRTLRLDADYYYTDFLRQAVIDYESSPTEIHIANLQGASFSHTMQVEASYELFPGMTTTAAYRYNKVKTTYNHQLLLQPLTSRYKALLSASYKPGLALWQFDTTLQLNGGGRIIGNQTFRPYEQLQAQVTRYFRHFDIYVGSENLTNKRQRNPIIAATDPWSTSFEPTLVYAPVEGRMVYAGIRMHIKKPKQ